jgi:hypothetical protein
LLVQSIKIVVLEFVNSFQHCLSGPADTNSRHHRSLDDWRRKPAFGVFECTFDLLQ